MKKNCLLILFLFLTLFVFKMNGYAKSVYCTYGNGVQNGISVTLGIDNGKLITLKGDENPVIYIFDNIAAGAFSDANGDYFCPEAVSYTLRYNSQSRRNDFVFSFILQGSSLKLINERIDNTPDSKKIDHTCKYGSTGKYTINYYTDGTIGAAGESFNISSDIPTSGSCLNSVYICTGNIIYKSPHWDNNNCTKLDMYYGNYFDKDDGSKDNTYYQSKLDISCSTNPNINKIAVLVGYIIYACRIIGPILIIILGMIDFFKATTSNDKEAVNKATKALIRRIIAGVAIFIIPTIISLVNDFLDISNGIENDSRFSACTKCILKPGSCETKN